MRSSSLPVNNIQVPAAVSVSENQPVIAVRISTSALLVILTRKLRTLRRTVSATHSPPVTKPRN